MSAEQHRVDEHVEELLAPMLGLDLFIVHWRGHPDTTEARLRSLLGDHLEWMIELESCGTLFASGPIVEGDSEGRAVRPGDGMTVLRAESLDAAGAIAAHDPFVVGGLREFSVQRWRLMEGSLSVELSFSKGSFRLHRVRAVGEGDR